MKKTIIAILAVTMMNGYATVLFEDLVRTNEVAVSADLALKADTTYVDSSVAAEAEDRVDADDALREIILSGQAISYEYYLSTNSLVGQGFSYSPTNAQYENCSLQSTNVGSFEYTYAATGTYGYVAFCTNQVFYTNAEGTAYAYDYASENVAGDIYEKLELYAFIVGSTNEIEVGDVAIPLQVTAGSTPVMRTFNIPYQAYSNTNGYYFGIKKKCTSKGAGSTVTQWVGAGYNTHVDLSLPSSVLADFYVAIDGGVITRENSANYISRVYTGGQLVITEVYNGTTNTYYDLTD